MLRFALSLLFLLFPLFTDVVGAAAAEALGDKIMELLNRPCLSSADSSVMVASVEDGRVIFEHNGHAPLIPASNMKLVTTAAALKLLGPSYKFNTQVFSDGPREGAALKGNLYMKGSGDPSLVREEMWLLARGIYDLGIRRIEGDIVGDETLFDGERYPEGWRQPANFRAYNAPISALSLNYNTVMVRVAPGGRAGEPASVYLEPESSYHVVRNNATTGQRGSGITIEVGVQPSNGKEIITVRGRIPVGGQPLERYVSITDPPLYAASVLKGYLGDQGVEVVGSARVGPSPNGLEPIYTHTSKPLSLIVWGLNKWSNNASAELVLKTLGAEMQGPPGTQEKGLEELRKFMSGIGVDEREYVPADGSGMSRLNRLSANAIVKLLIYAYNDFEIGAEYVSSLAVMGVDGSVKERIGTGWNRRTLRTKTGTLSGVSALSGYALSADGEVLAFSIIMNRFTCQHWEVWNVQDAIALAISRYSRQ